jgi:hypothetical protein
MPLQTIAFIVASAIMLNLCPTQGSAQKLAQKLVQEVSQGLSQEIGREAAVRQLFMIRTPREPRPSGGGKPQFQMKADAMLDVDNKLIESDDASEREERIGTRLPTVEI